MPSVDNKRYYDLLKEEKIRAISPAELAEDYEEYDKEWYHLLIQEKDFSVLVKVPGIKWFAICRCHFEADDGSTADEHMHALIHFTNGHSKAKLKRNNRKHGVKLNFKTGFHKINCLYHAVRAYRHISCESGGSVKRTKNGLARKAYVHYCRIVFNNEWKHKCDEKACNTTTNEISKTALKGVNIQTNYFSELELHNRSTCVCYLGEKKIEERKQRRKEQRLLRKTEAVKLKLKESRKKQDEKKLLLEQIMNFSTSTSKEMPTKAELEIMNIMELQELW